MLVERACSVDRVPLVIWKWIVTWLEPWDVIHMRGLCRWWRRLPIESLPYALLERISDDTPDVFLCNLTKYVAPLVGSKYIHRMPKLRTLDAAGCWSINDSHMKMLPDLEHVNIEDTYIKYLPTTLRSIVMNYRDDIDDALIKPLIHLERLVASNTILTWFPPSLRELDIFGCQHVTDDMIRPLQFLERLNASGTTVTWFPPSLRRLSIRNCRHVTLDMLRGLVNLTYLDVSSTAPATWLFGGEWPFAALRTLVIRNCPDVTEEMLEGLRCDIER